MMTERPKPELYLSPLRYFKVDETVLLVRRKRNGYFIVTATAAITVDKDMKVKAKVKSPAKASLENPESLARTESPVKVAEIKEINLLRVRMVNKKVKMVKATPMPLWKFIRSNNNYEMHSRKN